MDEGEKKQIVGMREAGQSLRQNAARFNVAQSVVGRLRNTVKPSV